MRAVSAFACLLLLFGCEQAQTVTPGVTVPGRSASAVHATSSAVPAQAPMTLPGAEVERSDDHALAPRVILRW
jgi:hypothetical protein